MSAVYLPSIYRGGKQRTQKINFNLIYTKFYADFRSGLRFGCYQRTILRYVIYLALSATLPSSVAFFLDRTSKVTTLQDRHIFQNGLLSRRVPDLYIHESDGDSFEAAMGKFL